MKELFGRIVTTEWLISNLLWEVVLLALSAFCITFLWKRIAYPRYQARKISIILLKENRPAIGQQHPKYLADRFIEIWSSTSVQ